MWIKYQTVDRGAATLGRQVAQQCGSVPTKLPHVGHSDGGLDSHFTLPYNKLIFLRLMSYICIIYRSCLLLR